jgi:SLT domain-containing protein
MKGKAALLIGAAAGYVLGARAGRERYQEIMSKADQLWHDPKVQEKASQAQDLAKSAAQKTAGKAKEAKDKTGSSSDSSSSASSSTGTASSGMSSGTASGTGTAPAPSTTPSTPLSSASMPGQNTSPIAESARPTPSGTGASGSAS